jgi:hypothetical protein
MLKLTDDSPRIEVSPSPSRLRAFPPLLVSGPPKFIVDVTQQLAWLMAVFRNPVYGQLSSSEIYFRRTARGTFKLQTLELSAVDGGEGSCWTPLFTNSVLARDFPVRFRPREWGQGVEVPFQMMARLAGIQFSVKHKGGIYLRGASTLLFPTNANTTAVQWHLIVSNPKNPWILDEKLDSQECYNIQDEDRLSKARTFLGVYKKAAVHLGTSNCKFDVDYSGADDEKPSGGCSLDAVQLGTSGMGIFGGQATFKFIQTKGLLAAGHQNSFERILGTAKTTPIILFDTHSNDRRGWLVSATSVMLHMVHVWARQESLKVELNYAKVAADGGLAAYKAIDDGSELDLRPKRSILTSGKSVRSGKAYKLKNLVESFWVQVCARKMVEALDRQKDGYVLRLKSQKLCGWELMHIVNGKSGRRKEVKSCEDRLSLTEDVLVLLGQNFGSLIRPATEISICGA